MDDYYEERDYTDIDDKLMQVRWESWAIYKCIIQTFYYKLCLINFNTGPLKDDEKLFELRESLERSEQMTHEMVSFFDLNQLTSNCVLLLP